MASKKFRKPLYNFLLLILFIISGLSCNFFTEPEPVVNNNTLPPKTHYGIANFKNYSQNQLVTGTIGMVFTPDWNPSSTDSVIVYVDSTLIRRLYWDYATSMPFFFQINTKLWPNGKHNIVLYAYRNPILDDSLGTMSLLTSTLFVYKTDLIFDNTTATAPMNINITLNNKDAHISWTPTKYNFFNSYVIRKNGEQIAEIFSQDSASYIDKTLPDLFDVYYEVGVSIKGQNAVYSNIYNLKHGETLPFSSAYYILDNLNDEVIFYNSGSITEVSTQTGQIISQTPGNFSSRNLWAKNITNDTIYCWDITNKSFFTYNTKPISLVDKRTIGTNNAAYALAVGPDGKIFVSTSNPDNYLFIYKNFGSVSDLIVPSANFENVCNFLSVSPDGHTLLAAEGNGIKNYSLDNNAVTFKFQSAIQDKIELVSVDWKNSRIFIKRQNEIVELWNLATLASISSYQLPASQPLPTGVTAIFANQNNFYAAYTINFHGSSTTLLAEYDISNQQFKRSWIFSTIIQKLLGSENGRYLFANTSTDQWIVDIGGAQ